MGHGLAFQSFPHNLEEMGKMLAIARRAATIEQRKALAKVKSA